MKHNLDKYISDRYYDKTHIKKKPEKRRQNPLKIFSYLFDALIDAITFDNFLIAIGVLFVLGCVGTCVYMIVYHENHTVWEPWAKRQTSEGYMVPARIRPVYPVDNPQTCTKYNKDVVQKECDTFNEAHGFFKDEQGYMFDPDKVTCPTCLERMRKGYNTPHLKK